MLRFYRITGVLLFFLAFLANPSYYSFAQCSITNLNATYCTDDAPLVLSAGAATNFVGNGVSAGVFTPSVAGPGNHTIYANDKASTYAIVTSGTFNRVAPPGTEVTLSLGKDTQSAILSTANGFFNFDFFGTTYNQLRIGSNGLVGIGTGTVTNPANTSVPTAAAPNNIIAAIWDDMTGTGTIKYWTIGSAPSRVFVVDFSLFRSGGLYASIAQVKLYESTNIIEIHTQTALFATNGNSASQGIENSGGTVGYVVTGRNNQSWDATNDYKAFVPVCLDSKTITVYGLPDISLNVTPVTTTVCNNSSVGITVENSEVGVLYQLQDNGTSNPLSGFYAGTGSDLVIPSDPLTLPLTIKVYARNTSSATCDGTLTNTSTITAINSAPAISLNPVDATVCEGLGTSFGVTATGTGISYQWQEDTGGGFVNLANGGVYSNVTTATMSISNVLGKGGYRYRAVVSGTCSPASTSTSATLTEQKNPVVIVPPSNATVCAGNNTTFSVTATGTGLTYQWQEDSGSGFGNIANGGVYSGATTANLTLTGVTAGMTGNDYRVVITGTCAPTTSAAGILTVNTLPVVTVNPVDATVCEGLGTSFGVTATGTGISYQWQEDTGGGFVNLANGGVYSNVTTATMSISNVLGKGGYRYRAVVSGTCSPASTSTSATLTEQKNPVVIVPPSNATVCAGNNTTFSVTATGTGLTYQWQEDSGSGFGNIANGGVYSGATTANLTLTGVTAGMTGNDYRVVITGTCAPTTSAAGILTVNTLPVVTVNPVDATVCEGLGTSFGVTATGTGISYQWQEDTGGGFVNLANGGVYSNVTTATMSISNVLGKGGYRYRAVVSGTCSPASTSTSATLTEQKNPVVIVPPSNATVCAGNNTTFSVTATGTGLTYQWQEDSGSGFGNIANGGVYSGATTANLTLTGVTAGMTGNDYRVVITGTCAPTTSAAGILTVNTLPVVTVNPVDATVCEGLGTSFGVTATGTGISYQWQEDTGGGFVNLANGGVYSNVTTATMSISNVLGKGGYRYRAVVSGTCSPASTSTSATLTEQKNPVVIVPPSNATVCAGNNTTFSVTATGTGLTVPVAGRQRQWVWEYRQRRGVQRSDDSELDVDRRYGGHDGQRLPRGDHGHVRTHDQCGGHLNGEHLTGGDGESGRRYGMRGAGHKLWSHGDGYRDHAISGRRILEVALSTWPTGECTAT